VADAIRARISVLAGTNGAGKSSIGGAMVRHKGADYFNPDEAARVIRAQKPKLTDTEANSEAWFHGKRLLEEAIAKRKDYVFETTLGGHTIASLLEKAAKSGVEVCVWYAGLRSPELHIARVKARVVRGGHDIPETDIRKRYDAGRRNLIRLLPLLTELRVYDNSADADPAAGKAPTPVLVLHIENGRLIGPADLTQTPEWAKPIAAAALKLVQR
jgi:predicted ABC-type ATPase